MLQCSLCFLDILFFWLNLELLGLDAFYLQNGRHQNKMFFFYIPSLRSGNCLTPRLNAHSWCKILPADSVPELTFLHLPVLLLAHTIQGHACSSNPHVEVVRGGVMVGWGSDAIGQAEARLAGG